MGHCCALGSVDRRDFLILLGAGLVAALGGCACAVPDHRANGSSTPPTHTTANSPSMTSEPVSRVVSPPLPPIPKARLGRPEVVYKAPGPTRQVALTIDDGYCDECAAGYVAFAERTGIALTMSPNGAFHRIWDRFAGRLRPLIAAGQVQIGNHTWSHRSLISLRDAAVRMEIERNEEWIEKSFGITARPWFRPPYGKRDGRIDALAASLGYTKIVMWNGTLGDAIPESPAVLLDLANRWIQAGAIVLGHANHPTVLGLFDQLQAIVAQRGLQPVTLDTMFGTTRATG